jgi:uncharacterized protein YegL
MVGEPLSAMEMGIQTLLNDLKNDAVCLDTVWVSIIAFSSGVEQLLPLSDVEDAEMPDMEASGTTALGAAITFVSEKIDEEVRKTTADQKGDWKPMVFVFTDGEPTDDWEEPVEALHTSKNAVVVACGAGPDVDDVVLSKLGDHALRLNDTQPGTLAAFMQWVTLSVTARSHSLGTGVEFEVLPDPPAEVMIIP